MLFNNDIFICKSEMNIMKFCCFTCYALSFNFSKSDLLNRPLNLLMPTENTSPVEVSPINDIDPRICLIELRICGFIESDVNHRCLSLR